jgi:hypothetical protein
LSGVELHNIFRESLLSLENFVKFAALNEWHDKIKSLWGLEQIVHTH